MGIFETRRQLKVGSIYEIELIKMKLVSFALATIATSARL